MGPGERAAFETLLRTDAALKEELTVHAGVQNLARRQQFEQQVALAARDYFAETPVQQQRGQVRTLYWSMAAAVALLAAIGIFVFAPQPSPGELFQDYFTHYEVPAVLRSDKPLYETAGAQEAFMMYQERNYTQAIPGFTKALAQAPNDMLMVFCRGICYVATGDTDAAVRDFDAVIKENNNLFVPQARWYLALAHLKAGRAEAARAELRVLDDAKARTLLKELE